MAKKNNGETAVANTEDKKEEKKFIVDGVAVSPFDEFPGEITGFPKTFGGALYKKYIKANAKQAGDPDDGFYRFYPHYRILTEAIQPDISLTLPEGQDINDPDTLDTRILWWFSRVTLEYLTPFLMPDI